MRTYKKPMITVDSGLAEGVYAASGASQGTLNVTYHGVWDRWGTNGGKGLAMANWSDLNGTITLNITFNDTVDQAETDDASVQTSWSGKTATFTFASTASHSDRVLSGLSLMTGSRLESKLRKASATASANRTFCISITILRIRRPPINHFESFDDTSIAKRPFSRTVPEYSFLKFSQKNFPASLKPGNKAVCSVIWLCQSPDPPGGSE